MSVTVEMECYRGVVRVCMTLSGLAAVSADGNIEFLSESLSRIFLGYTHSDLVGKVHCFGCNVTSLRLCEFYYFAVTDFVTFLSFREITD